jgi:MFS family permease
MSLRLKVFSSVPRKVRWLIYAAAPTVVAYGYLLVFISAYLPELGVNPGSVGLLLGASGAAFVVSAIPLGVVSDRRGRKPLLMMGTIALVPVAITFALTADLPSLLIASTVGGVSEGAFLSTWNAMIADQTTLENRNQAFSLSFIVSTAGVGAGSAFPMFFPALQRFLALDSHMVHIGFLVLSGLLAAATPIALWILLGGYVETIHSQVKFTGVKGMGLLLRFSALNGLIGLGGGFIIPLIPTWLFLRFSLSDTYSGPLLALSNLTMGLAAVASPRLAREYGSVTAIVITQSLSLLFMFSLAFIPDVKLAAAFYILRSIFMNMATPISDSFLMSIVPSEQRGLASAVNTLFWRLPNSISTVIGGLLLQAGMFDTPFFLATGFYVVSISLFFASFRNARPSN